MIRETVDRVPLDWLAEHSLERALDQILRSRVSNTAEVITDPPAFSVEAVPVSQREAERRDRFDGDDPDASRIPCHVWSIKFRVKGAYDLLGRIPEGAGLKEYPRGEVTPPPAISWSLSGEEITATCWVAANEASDMLEPPRDLIQEASSHLRAWVEHANGRLDEWRQRMRGLVGELVETRHRDAVRAVAINRELNELLGTSAVEPLEVPATEAPAPAAQADRPAELPRLLSDANAEDLVKVINRWTDAIGSDQGPFQKLMEEEHSALLVATLRGAFGRATREVFSGKGKLDFQVTACAMQPDGLPIAFGGEVKVWTGEKGFLEAVQQELDNCTSNTADGVLIVIVRDRESFVDMRETGRAAMRERYPEVDSVAGRPAFLVPRPADAQHLVRLTVIFVDETRKAENLDQRAAG